MSTSKVSNTRARSWSRWLIAGAVGMTLVIVVGRGRLLDSLKGRFDLSQRSLPALVPTTAPPSPMAAAQPNQAQAAPNNAAAAATPALPAEPQITLQKVDDYPLYVMTYDGEYRDLDARPAAAQAADPSRQWACSLFTAFGTPGGALYGRNFDWDFSPVVLLFTHPRNGFASVSMVDIAYLDFKEDEVGALSPTDKRLLDAPLLPFDGMNERGLTVGMAAVRDSKERPPDPSRSPVGSLGIIRLMLDRASTTEEAVEILRTHQIDFTGGPPLHYLIGDPSGRSAVVEFINGTFQVTWNDAPWQIATNFFVAGASPITKRLDGRYATASARLSKAQGQLSPADAMDLLNKVQQDITQWSIVYNMSTGDIGIAMARNYKQIHSFHLGMAPVKG